MESCSDGKPTASDAVAAASTWEAASAALLAFASAQDACLSQYRHSRELLNCAVSQDRHQALVVLNACIQGNGLILLVPPALFGEGKTRIKDKLNQRCKGDCFVHAAAELGSCCTIGSPCSDATTCWCQFGDKAPS